MTTPPTILAVKPHVTIAVCTFNRAGMLVDALQSLRGLQTEDRFTYDVLVVDNASTDDTAAVIARAALDTDGMIRGVYEANEGVAHARNRAVREARGAWIAFFDDDQLADPRWLLCLMKFAEAKQVRCVGGAVHLRLPVGVTRRLAPVCREFLGETVGEDAPRRYTRRQAPGTGNMLLAQSVFDEVGLFRTDLHQAGEDTDLFRRMCEKNIAAWYTPEAIVHHVIPPHRLEENYLSWTAHRLGGHVARRERDDWGATLFVPVLAARLGQLLFQRVPRWALAHAARDPEKILGSRCWIWFATGYLRHGLTLLAPRWFSQEKYLERLKFRAERMMAAPQ
jgi:glycosyltransferase involved in cell wall biosynthesis